VASSIVEVRPLSTPLAAYTAEGLMGAGWDDIGGILCRVNLLCHDIGGAYLRSLVCHVNLGIEF
jgi:hypothetical protein